MWATCENRGHTTSGWIKPSPSPPAFYAVALLPLNRWRMRSTIPTRRTM